MSQGDFLLRELSTRPVVSNVLEGLDPVMERILAARGVTRPDQIDLGLARMAPVSALNGIADAVALLIKHRNARITIVGDFDADGATSTALVWRCLSRLGFADVRSLVPNRFDFGYGLSAPLVALASKDKPQLIITVDNGISSVEGVAAARAVGIDVLITDHHLPPEVLPDANVIVNPNLDGDAYPSKNLAGVGVAFCLMAALARELADGDPNISRLPADYLDLVALGTVADVVPLDQNNRILVHAGLQRIRAGRCVPGITALLNVAGRDPSRIVAADLGFAVGPRLNAAGRLEDMSVGIQCLMADTDAEAMTSARALDEINRARRDIESTMQGEAMSDIAVLRESLGPDLPPCVCLHQSQWHQGIVGLIASRIKEQTGRPVFAFADDGEGKLKGSGRSIAGVHLRDLLAEVDAQLPGAISKFGGHAMAAGLTLQLDALAPFTKAAAHAMTRLFPNADFSPVLLTDGMLPEAHLSKAFADKLRNDLPWGQQFPEPSFSGQFVVDDVRIVGERHLKFRLATGDRQIDAIAFGQNRDPLPERGDELLLCYRLDVNVWRQRESLQLIVEQWQVVSS